MSAPGRLTEEKIAANFADMHPPLTPSEAIIDADRCYFCYDAPCTTACPTGIDIPGFIQKIRSGNLKGSAHTILSENIMGGMCARVCPTEVLCEEACVRNTHEDRPVRIGTAAALRHGSDLREQHAPVRTRAGHRAQGRHRRRRPRGLSVARIASPCWGTARRYSSRWTSWAGSTNTASRRTRRWTISPRARSNTSSSIGGIEVRTGVGLGKDRFARRAAQAIRRGIPGLRPCRRQWPGSRRRAARRRRERGRLHRRRCARRLTKPRCRSAAASS